jgi:hypothetical protein
MPSKIGGSPMVLGHFTVSPLKTREMILAGLIATYVQKAILQVFKKKTWQREIGLAFAMQDTVEL